MKVKKISEYTSMEWLSKAVTACLFVLTGLNAHAQDVDTAQADSLISKQDTITQKADSTQEILMPGEKPKPSKYIAIEGEKKKLLPFMGFTVSADVLGPIMLLLSDNHHFEAALRLNMYNTYFPIFEAGYGFCKIDDYNTKVKYETNAPYARVGVDMNILKDKYQDNRLYVGLRYGISRFNYDLSGPVMADPIWGGSEDFDLKGIGCTSQWGEFVFGLQAKVFSMFHVGWSVRYKMKIHETKTQYTNPCYVPGYGKGSFFGTFNLIFDLNWGKGKTEKKTLLKAEIKE